MIPLKANDHPVSPWRKRALLTLLILLTAFALSTCSGVGACVGSGGNVLLSPVCKDGWTRAECREWDEMEVNDANWDFKGGTCEGLGYTDRCSDGSFRLPGDC
jgi:predicted small secreted protein